MKLATFIQIAGILHLGLIWAGATMPRVVGLRPHLDSLPVFLRRLFWVYYVFIGGVLLGFGGISFFFAHELASGAPLSRAVCALMLAFWLGRLAVAVFVFDVRPYLTKPALRAGYHATNVVFLGLPIVYGAALFGP